MAIILEIYLFGNQIFNFAEKHLFTFFSSKAKEATFTRI